MKIKTLLLTSLVLVTLDHQKYFKIDVQVDASDYGIDAVLLQEVHNRLTNINTTIPHARK